MTDIAALGLRIDGIAELERLSAAMEKLEGQQDKVGGSTKVLATERKQLKTPTEQAAKATEQLTEAERKFAEQARKAGMSVNELKNNLRGLPAQFTDIAVSLQGGQAPLTVFLQQGGQLKDMFNGAGNAARAMGGYVTGLINPFSLAATAVAALGVAYYQGSKEADAFRVSLATTGNAIGTTTDALTIYSRQIAEAGETQGKAAESLNVFVSAGFRSEELLAQFTRTAIAWERATGEGVDSVAEKFVALEKDPLKAALKLNESMNFLTVDIYKQIQALEDQGNKLGAAALAMGAYDSAMAKSSKVILENMGYLEYSAYVVTTGFKGMWDMVAGIGRPSPESDKLAKAYNELNDLVLAGAESHHIQAGRVKELRSQIALLEGNSKATRDKTEADKQQAIAVKELEEFQKTYGKYLKEELTLSQSIAKAKEEAKKQKLSEAETTKLLNGITEEYNKKNKTRVASTKAIENSYRTLAERAAEYVKSLQLEAQQGEKISKSQQLEIELQSLLVRGKGKGTDAAVASTKALIAEAKAMETQAKARKAMAEAAEQYQKDLEEIAEYQQKESEAVAKQAQATYEAGKALENESRMLELQAGLIGASTQARELAIEQLRIQIELEKELDALDNDKALPSDKREEAKAKARERAVQRGANAEKKILIDSYNEIGKYVEDALYDAIVTGGASAGEALERMFKNLVLQPIVKAGVQSLLGSVGMGGGEGVSGGSGVSLPGTSFSIAGSLSGASYDASLKALEYGFNDTAKSLVSFGNTIQNADAWLKNIPGMSGGLNSAIGYGSALLSLSQGNYGSAVGGALGTLVGAGNPIGTWIGSTLGSLVDGVFGGGSTPHAGAASQYAGGQITAGGKQFTRSAINADYTAGLQGSVDSLAFTLGSTLDGLDKIFGGQGGFSVTTGFKADSDDPSNATLQISNASGDTLVKWLAQRSGEFGSRATGQSYASDPSEGFDEYLKAITAATIPQFKAVVPQWADAMLDSFGQSIGFSGNASDWESISVSGAEAMQALQQVAAQIAQVDQAFASLSETLPMFAGITDDVKSSLIGALGGFEGFSGAANTFYNAFYSEAERMENLSRQVESAVGIDPRLGEKAKEQYRAAVETALQGGQGELAAQLLSLSGTFATAADYAKQAGTSLSGAMAEWLRGPLISLESRMTGGFDRKYMAEDASRGLQELLSSVGVESDAGQLAKMMLTATSAEVEAYFREVWDILPTEEANLALVGLTETMMDLAAATDAARDAAAQAAVQSMSGAWGNFSSVAGMAAQYTGNTTGLSSQLGIMQQSYAGATDTNGRVASLQQIIGLEQGLWQAEQQRMQAQQQAAQASANAARDQLASVNQLLEASRRLREFAQGLFSGGATGLSNEGRMDILGAQYQGLLGKNDAESMQAIQGVTTDYLELSKATANSQIEYNLVSSRMAAELAAQAAISEASASSQVTQLSVQIASAEAAAGAASAQFKVSESTQKLIDELLIESALAFENEATDAQKMIDNGTMTVEALQSLPAELAGAIGASLIPAIRDIASTVYVQERIDGSHATGLARVPFDGYMAKLHKDEAVVPAQYNPFNGGSMGMMGADVANLLMQIITDNRAQFGALVRTTGDTSKMLTRWNNDGIPDKRKETA